ncbi:hypothetical protein [Cronobacter dublinensis]|uniref:hypothetical protein n=1 Tax=Cronobacter dublinensis TaxID=413497 RepID=UPI00300DD675
MNNDELIAAGHELAKCLDNEPLLDIAKMIVRLADKLDVTTAALREKTKQHEALAAPALPTNIAEIIDSGDLEAILFASEALYSQEYRMALYEFRQLRLRQGGAA